MRMSLVMLSLSRRRETRELLFALTRRWALETMRLWQKESLYIVMT